MRISIDPGIPFGWACWSEAGWHTRRMPSHYGETKIGSKKGDWLKRAALATKEFSRFFTPRSEISHVYIEQPRMFQTATGYAASAGGALGKLHLIVGAFAAVAWQHGAQVVLVPVNDWKGQLTKHATNLRIERVLGPQRTQPLRTCASHVWDAVGIGLHVKGFAL